LESDALLRYSPPVCGSALCGSIAPSRQDHQKRLGHPPYEDPKSLKDKTDYVRHRNLGGVMFWELTGDTDDGDLISAIHEGLARGPD
jgi:hypothetical protein